MAQYHSNAEILKPLVEKADFNEKQLSIVLRMMEKCSQLRQQKVIRSFFECMIPEAFEMVEDSNNPVTYERNGTQRTFNPSIIIKKGDPLPEARVKDDKEIKEVLDSGEF